MITDRSPQPPPDALRCPRCACPEVPVYYTRRRSGTVRRVRRCRHCGKRFATVERIAG